MSFLENDIELLKSLSKNLFTYQMNSRFSGSVEDLRLYKDIGNKKISQTLFSDSINEESPTKMFETFLIVGCDPNKPSQKPSLLSMFPSTDSQWNPNEIDHITSFCFPNGLTPITKDEDNNRTILDEFSFLLHRGSNEIYGLCLHLNGNSQDMPFFGSPSSLRFPFCLCLLSRNRFLSSHFTFLSYLALLLTNQAPLPHRNSVDGSYPHPKISLPLRSSVPDTHKSVSPSSIPPPHNSPLSNSNISNTNNTNTNNISTNTNNISTNTNNISTNTNNIDANNTNNTDSANKANSTDCIKSPNNVKKNILSPKQRSNSTVITSSPISERKQNEYGLIEERGSPQLAVSPNLSYTAPRVLVDILTFYQRVSTTQKSVPLPRPMSTAVQGIKPKQYTLASGFHITIADYQRPEETLAQSTIHALLNSLTPQLLVEVYTAFILEQRILMLSSSLHKCSLAVLALTAIAAPFSPSANILPTLPTQSAFIPLSESPTPYLIGCTVDMGNSDIIIDLDKGTVRFSENLPKLPQQEKLVQALKTILKAAKKESHVPQKKKTFGGKDNPAYIHFVNNVSSLLFPFKHFDPDIHILMPPIQISRILATFRDHLARIVDEIIPACYVSDTTDPYSPVTVLNEEMFMGQVNTEDIPFFTAFLNTHCFQVYSNMKADEYAAHLSYLR